MNYVKITKGLFMQKEHSLQDLGILCGSTLIPITSTQDGRIETRKSCGPIKMFGSLDIVKKC